MDELDFHNELDIHDEMDANLEYLSDLRKKINDPNFEILEWWSGISNKYKIVAQMAKDVLAIQMSIVTSKSTFSLSGWMLDPFRSLLSPRTVETLIYTKNWLSDDGEEPIVLR